MKKYLLLFLLVSYCLMIFPVFSWAGQEGIKAPKTLEEIKSFFKKILELLPEALREIWQKVLMFWQKIFEKIKQGWDKLLGQRLAKILDSFKKEIEKRKSIFKQELEKEIQELK